MTATAELDIAKALEVALNTAAGALSPAAVPVHWPNVPFDPAVGTSYLEPLSLPVPNEMESLGRTGTTRHTGIYQIGIWVPADGGLGLARSIAQQLINAFQPGTALSAGSGLVHVLSASLGVVPPITGPWAVLPVELRWYSLQPTN